MRIVSVMLVLLVAALLVHAGCYRFDAPAPEPGLSDAETAGQAGLPPPLGPSPPDLLPSDEGPPEPILDQPGPPPEPGLAQPAPEPLISDRARALIIRWEIGSPERYTRLYTRPICPLCDRTASGPTIGIGSDLGHQTRAGILADWAIHPQVADLPQAAGVRGRAAIPLTRQMQHIETPYWMAERVFDQTAVVTYYRIAKRSFGANFVNLNPDVRGVLVSLVYNRGGDTNCRSDMRVEMCNIANVGVPNGDYFYIASQIRAMKRHWVDKGLKDRREDEARLIELSLSS